jgi:hypothetical protein
VQPIPATGAKWQISASGGGMPTWRGDGRELYFRDGDGALLAVAVVANANSFEAGAPRLLFAGIPSAGNLFDRTYVPSDDGERFLVQRRAATEVPPIVVVVNWWSDLADSAPGSSP